MAYNNYFPFGYNNQYQAMAQQPMPAPQQMQSNGFVSVRNMQEAFNYPIAPGNSLMFKDENSPYIYTKTKGFSQLDEPVFERYRLVKEEAQEMAPVASTTAQNSENEYALRADLKALEAAVTVQIDELKKRFDTTAKATKKESVKNAD